MMHTVFIDGEAGTTGLDVLRRLEARADLEIIALGDRRRDVEARHEALNAADAVILCLPDDAAKEAVAMIENPGVRVIDASTAYRVDPAWTYGFAEMAHAPGRMTQGEKIAGATRVSNPGCYPTGFIGLVRPLVSAGIIPAGMEMMDRPAIHAAEAFVHAGYPLDVEALLIVGTVVTLEPIQSAGQLVVGDRRRGWVPLGPGHQLREVAVVRREAQLSQSQLNPLGHG